VHWLEAIYNRRRRHSAIDMLSPVDYEERYWERRAAANAGVYSDGARPFGPPQTRAADRGARASADASLA
jgi:hypothetical protein